MGRLSWGAQDNPGMFWDPDGIPLPMPGSHLLSPERDRGVCVATPVPWLSSPGPRVCHQAGGREPLILLWLKGPVRASVFCLKWSFPGLWGQVSRSPVGVQDPAPALCQEPRSRSRPASTLGKLCSVVVWRQKDVGREQQRPGTDAEPGGAAGASPARWPVWIIVFIHQYKQEGVSR